jgi:hypothetical protein
LDALGARADAEDLVVGPPEDGRDIFVHGPLVDPLAMGDDQGGLRPRIDTDDEMEN